MSTRLPVKRLLDRFPTIGLRDRDGLCRQASALVALEVAAAVQPWGVECHLLLEAGDLVLHLHGKTDVVETVDEAVLAELLDVEAADLLAGGVVDDLVGEVDFDIVASAGFGCDELHIGWVGDGNGEHAVLEGVVEEDIRVRGSDDALNTKIEEGPWGVLSRASATEIGSCDDEDL